MTLPGTIPENLLQCYSQSCWLLNNQLFPKNHQLEHPPEGVPASSSHGTFFSGTVELYQSNYGMARNHKASGFVNSTVKPGMGPVAGTVCNSTIHKATGLRAPCHSMILPGTIPVTPISCEWSQQLERPLGVVPTGKKTYRQLCE